LKEAESRYQDYEDHFLGEKPLALSKKNRFFVNSYLFEVKKRSDGAYRNHKSALKSFFDYIDKPADKVTKFDVINYFNDVLDKKDIKKSTKKRYRSYLRSFFYHVEALTLKKKNDFNNPVPNNKLYKFTKKSNDLKKQSQKDEKLLTMAQLNEILDYCRKNLPKKVFIFFGLAIATGARASEIRTIALENINLEERYFETGFEKNARKSTMNSEECLLFFFPRAFKIYLENYIYELDGDFLFPTQLQEYPSANWSQQKVNKIRKALGFHFTMHYFRHSLITYLKTNGCPADDRKMLLNHSMDDVQAEYYTHLSIEEKRAIYDKFFPYYSIKYFQI